MPRLSAMTPIAVIGMACRLPAGIDSPQKMWEALLRGDDLVTEVPRDRWDAEDIYDADKGVPGRSVSKWGSFIDDVIGFDPEFFGISEREATAIDPQHRMLMETAWEAVEHAGLTPGGMAGTSTGVFLGMSHDDYVTISSEAGALDQAYAFSGTPFSMASGRVSHSLGLRGPSLTVDTACSSSLVAVHQACRNLHEGESDMALAGGIMLMLHPSNYASASGLGMLSPTGRCHSFDVAADGFVRAEACGIVLLKRLDDAVRDGDRVLAVIRNTAANQDGRTRNILTPSKDAQIDVFRAALVGADVDPATVGMVEAHGTGTPVGDGIEYASVAAVYGTDGPCALTSIKSNLGHAEAAAGVLGLMKAVLSVHHGLIPKNLHFHQMPERMAAVETALFVPTEATPWPVDGPRRAAVSSYGMSGTNAHAVIEQAPADSAAVNGDVTAEPAGLLVFPISSTSPEQLRRTAGRLADWVGDAGAGLALGDLSYTLTQRRGFRPVRTATIAAGRDELVESLRRIATGDDPHPPAVGQDDRGPVWVFSGQGSQWAAMGAALLDSEPAFAAKIAEIEPLIAAESGFSVTDALRAPETVTGIDRIQPAIFAMQVAMAATMDSHGVRPGAVIGHSMGEVAAAVVAGALSLCDGVKVICHRSLLCRNLSGGGAMAAVELPAQVVREELERNGIDDVVVAVVTSPASTVIGGSPQAVRDLVEEWEQRGVMAREVAVDVASHSPHVEPVLDDLAERLADITPLAPEVPYYSATLFDPREQPYCDADYWVDNLRHTVRFSAAVQSALEDGYRVFAELAPHPLLVRAIEQNAAIMEVPVAALAGMRREQDLPHGMRSLLADLYSAGAAIDFTALVPTARLVDAPLPTWTHRDLMLQPQTGQGRRAHVVAAHPLLGAHVRLLEEPERHVWQADVGTDALPWLVDHQVNNVPAMPGAAFCEMALAAAHTALGDSVEIRDVRFERMLLLDGQTPLSATASMRSPGSMEFLVETDLDGERERRASAVLHAVSESGADRPAGQDIDVLLASCPQNADGGVVRQWFDTRGVQFGPAFTALSAVNAGEDPDTVLAEIGLPSVVRNNQSAYSVHPALLDACFQSVAAHPGVQNSGSGGLLLPLGIRRLRTYGPVNKARYCLTRVVSLDGSGVEADIQMLDDNGAVLLAAEGLQMGSGRSEGDGLLSERLLAVEWRKQQLPDLPAHLNAGTWLLVNTSDSPDLLASELTDVLKLNDATVTPMSWPQHADHAANAERLRTYFAEGGFGNVVVVAAPLHSVAPEQVPARGAEHVRHLVRITRELADADSHDRAVEPPRLYVVTREAASVLPTDRPNLEQGGLRGLVRVIGAEHPQLRPTLVDVDDDTAGKVVAQHLLLGGPHDETAFRNDEWYTAQLFPSPLRPEERCTTVVDNSREGMRLDIRTPGDLQTLELTAHRRVPPGPGEIEVAVTASSLNFADVLVAMGRYPSYAGNPRLGIDFAGIVVAVGPDVTSHRVGDHVGGMSPNGCWGTFLTCTADLAVTLPTGLRDDQAAAVSTAAATAWYGLHDLARIGAGDKVLIHSATGGVGQAAIAIARLAGAEIYATAGTAERRQLLRRMGINHVYDSRSLAFADQIRMDTGDYGVDIVLNSLTGAAQRAGMELLAFGGRFVEIGKKDIYGDTRMGLFPFRRNLSFYGVDLALMCSTHPERISGLLRTVYRLTAEGVLPQPETTHYPLSEAATAIRVMGAAEHTGKLILSIPHTGHTNVVVPPEQIQVFRPDGAYIVTGGTGGLGLFLAGRMSAGGAGRIVLNSRSGPNPAARERIEQLRAAGTEVEVVTGDIAVPETVDRLVAAATASGLPVRGVLHAAAVVEDATLTNITDDLVERDWAPKVYGAWHLHRATTTEPLDWFCSFSSAAALLGSPGQGAYAAANSWLDAFTQWRRSHGLPATAVAWAAWDEIGAGKHLAASGTTTMIKPDEGAQAFEALLAHNRAVTGYVPVIGTPWLTDLAARSPFAEAFASSVDRQADNSGFRAELHSLPREEWPVVVRRLVTEQLSLILRRSVDPDRPISEYGLDSLGNLELRTRIETETAVRVRAMDITTVRGLADSLCDSLAAAVPAAR